MRFPSLSTRSSSRLPSRPARRNGPVGRTGRRLVSAALAVILLAGGSLLACPFCAAPSRTLSEQMESFDIVVIAEMMTEPVAEDDVRLPRATFRVKQCLRGSELFSQEEIREGKEFESIVVSKKDKPGDLFLVMGNGTRNINWSTPMQISPRVREYLEQLKGLPESGGDRLAFFYQFLEDDEPLLANDAYDEFASASYAAVKELGERLDRKQLVAWVQDPDVLKVRKGLYYTLLGICGGDDEIAFLEEVIQSGDRERQSGLDALIACYLTLKGDEGVPLVESTFLDNPAAEHIDVFSAITALRFHATEADKVSKDRIVQAFHYVLKQPKMADMVINDLARLEDWTVMDQLVAMFREANSDDTKWVRTPIISYLQACPLPVAKQHIATLREIDPQAVERAEMLADIDWADDEEDADDEPEDDGDSDSSTATPESTESASSPGSGPGSQSGDGKESSLDETDADDDQESSVPVNLTDVSRTEELATKPATMGGSEEGEPADTVIVLRPAESTAKADEGGLHHDAERFVSDTPRSPLPVDDVRSLQNTDGQMARSAQPLQRATGQPKSEASWIVILLTMGTSGIILFGLIWSAFNGSFSKLIS